MNRDAGHEKAVGVLDTPTTASKTISNDSLPTAEILGNIPPKEYATLRAQFALLGKTVTRCHAVPAGRIIYAVTGSGESRYFTHAHDLHAYLTQIQAAHACSLFKKRVF